LVTEAGFVLEGVFDEGAMVGWGGYKANAPAAGRQPFLLVGGVHPDHLGRGLGTLVAGRALAGARAVHASEAPTASATYAYRGEADRPGQTALLRSLGFTLSRYRFNMVADLDPDGVRARPRTVVPDGYDLLAFRRQDAEQLREAHNRAFAAYPNMHPAEARWWQSFLFDAPHARPALSFWLRARGSGGVAAYLASCEFGAPVSGLLGVREMYVPYLGVAPEQRGRGLGSWLLRRALEEYAAAGYDTASLEVDAENPDGALGLYERAGFRRLVTMEEWLVTDPPAR
jgi:ribosomal protein S18 acetylase RimI-like enzyme